MMKMMSNLSKVISIKKIASLTKVLCREYFETIPALGKKIAGQNKLFKICTIIAIIGLSYLSYYILDFLNKIQYPQIFLNIYLLVLAILIMFQQILASLNVYYFSKDLEYILPYPIKPVELLIGRFNMLVSVSYMTIALFGLIPLIIYGMMAGTTIFYYLYMVIVLLLFPIFFGLIISIIMLFVIQLSKIIKNQEIFQFVATTLIMIVFFMFEGQVINSVLSNVNEMQQIQQGEQINLIQIIDEKVQNANKYLVTLNPSVGMLTEKNIIKVFINLLKIIFANIVAIVVFIFTGKHLYLKNILKSIQKVNVSNKKIKKKRKELKYKIKARKQSRAYIRNEFKQLIKVPTFFFQCILPIFSLLITIIVVVIALQPTIIEMMKIEEVAEGIEQMTDITITTNTLVTILIVIQILFTFSNLSITAISRKGKDAFFTKCIPLSLYKQFIYMNIPQILLNTIISIVVLGLAKFLIPELKIIQLIALLIMATLINILNSFLMLVADLRKPNLNWDNETDAIKQSQNKIFQYVLAIVVSLVLVYISTVFEKLEVNLNLAIVFILIFLLGIVLITNKIIKSRINKIFSKINQ